MFDVAATAEESGVLRDAAGHFQVVIACLAVDGDGIETGESRPARGRVGLPS